MEWDDFTSAVRSAKSDVSRGDSAIRELAGLMVGRIRLANIPGAVLAKLKRELRDFNLQTWKGKNHP